MTVAMIMEAVAVLGWKIPPRHTGLIHTNMDQMPTKEAVVARMSGRMPRSERTRSDRTPVGIHLGAGMAAVLVALIVAGMIPASVGAGRLAPVAVALIVTGAYTVDPAAVAFVATVAHLLVIGFLVNRYGVLTWHGAPDMYRLLAIVVSAGAGLLLGAVRRRVRRPPPLVVPAEWIATHAGVAKAIKNVNKEEFPGG